MSPIRKSDDYRATEIDSWDDYIEEEIVGMQARGEFENLPDQGKPIKIWTTDVNPEMDLAFSRLKNAGVMPLWMELDRDIGRLTEELWARLDWVEQLVRHQVAQLQTPAPPEVVQQVNRWQRFWSWFRIDNSVDAPAPPTVTSIKATVARERTKFLELAAELDKKISTFNDSLPRGGEHLQRLRWIPSRAAREFDERISLADFYDSATDRTQQ